MHEQPKNTWYCNKCDFYVFNSKPQCSKCLTNRPTQTLVSYDPQFDESVCDFLQQQHLQEKTNCGRCKTEGRVYNNEPLKSNHNCWKYS